MAGLLTWLKTSTSQILDPSRNERVKAAATILEQQLAVQRSAFDLHQATANLDIFREDMSLVIEQTYRLLLRRAWRDGIINESERKTLNWAAKVLGLTEEKQRQLDQQTGLDTFRNFLADAMADGHFDEKEIDRLKAVSKQLGMPVGNLIRQYFSSESNGILRSLFAGILEDGAIAQEEWDALSQTVSNLGLSKHDLLEAIRSQAEQLVEQSLAEAKADEQISPDEEGALQWMLTHLIVRPEFKSYVQQQINYVKFLHSIEQGHLPSITSRQLGLRAGEIVHLESPTQFRRTRQTKSGERTEIFEGLLTLTDTRLIFTSNTMGIDVNHRRALSFTEYSNGFGLTADGKGTGIYLPTQNPSLFNRVYRVAVRMANQTVIKKTNGDLPSRHIPRDVRQRVFQRYGGRCADCAATDYLEFDHIIPVAKGGSNDENNVQLLCRRCNGKKSDRI